MQYLAGGSVYCIASVPDLEPKTIRSRTGLSHTVAASRHVDRLSRRATANVCRDRYACSDVSFRDPDTILAIPGLQRLADDDRFGDRH